MSRDMPALVSRKVFHTDCVSTSQNLWFLRVFLCVITKHYEVSFYHCCFGLYWSDALPTDAPNILDTTQWWHTSWTRMVINLINTSYVCTCYICICLYYNCIFANIKIYICVCPTRARNPQSTMFRFMHVPVLLWGFWGIYSQVFLWCSTCYPLCE